MQQYRRIAKTMNGKAPKRCRQKRVLMIPAHYRIKASDAFGPGSPRRLRWHERQNREVAPAGTKTEYALVAQLDSVSASDAEGCGFDPRRVHHEKSPIAGFFSWSFPPYPAAARAAEPHPAAALQIG